MSKKNRDGEYIALVWDNTADAYYVRGHIEIMNALEIVVGENCLDNADGITNGRHVYARWSMQGDAPEGCTCILREYVNSGKGRFKVTAFDNEAQ
jgi:hypothetical protein